MRVLLTGATGLLGGSVAGKMVRDGHEVRCLVRAESPNRSRLGGAGVQVVPGDCSSVEDLRRAMVGADAVVHVAGIEYSPQVTQAMKEAKVDRLVAVSSTSAHSGFESRSGPKLAMERVVEGSGLGWTVVRPTMIYGTELDKNVHKLLRFLDRFPVFPVFGDGENLWQPVYFEDCSAGVCESLYRDGTVGRTYDLPGARPLGYGELVAASADALGVKRRVVNLPVEPVRRALALAERLRLPLPVGSDQVARLREDKAYPYDEASRDLDYSPRPFEEGVVAEVERLRERGVIQP